MSIAAEILTWDMSPAQRPSLDNMGGASLVDDAVNPPDPEKMPTAASLNQVQNQCQALAKVAMAFAMDVVNNGTTASLARFTAAGTNIVNGTFTVSRISVGLVQITWAAGTFPVSVVNPHVQMTTDAAWCAAIPIPISNGVQIKTRNSAGALTDGNFTLFFL